jgi:hypothetical protein
VKSVNLSMLKCAKYFRRINRSYSNCRVCKSFAGLSSRFILTLLQYFSVKVVKDWRTRAQTEVYDKPDLVSGLLETSQELWMMLDTEERKR